MLTEQEAYGDRLYSERALTRYEPGNIVRIGPAYRMGNRYVHEGPEGIYTVIGELSGSNSAGGLDYYLARGLWRRGTFPHWDVISKAFRLTLVRKEA